jgi:hypothetical protein
LHERVAEKQADGLRLLIVVGACRPFVAAFRNCLQIALAYVNRQSTKSAARPFPQGSHSLGRCSHGGLSIRRGDGARKPFPRCERPKALGCDRQSRRRRLAPVYDWFTEQFDTRDLKEAKALLDELAA